VQSTVDRLKQTVLRADLDGFLPLVESLRGGSQVIESISQNAPIPVTAEVKISSAPPVGPEAGAPTRQDFVWSSYPFNDGEDGNARVLRSFEEEYAARVRSAGGNLKAPGLLLATLDLAGAYIKNYSLDKADLILKRIVDECRRVGPPWDTKCLQDLATLRFKQNRQPECAKLLEEVAQRSPPHPAISENLGTVYNSLGRFELALKCFEEAVALKGGVPEKEDFWNLGLVHNNLGDKGQAVDMLQKALDLYAKEEECPVTVAKVHDSLADCHLGFGDADAAVANYSSAVELYRTHVGTNSPLYGASVDGLSRSLESSGRRGDAFDALVSALAVQSVVDGIHPTPLFELLDRAVRLHRGRDEDSIGEDPQKRFLEVHRNDEQDQRVELERLVVHIEAALANLKQRGLDNDGNAGVVLQKAGEIFLLTVDDLEARGDRTQATSLRSRAAEILRQGKLLMEKATDAGEGDLSELCVIAAMQIGLAEARLAADAVTS